MGIGCLGARCSLLCCGVGNGVLGELGVCSEQVVREVLKLGGLDLDRILALEDLWLGLWVLEVRGMLALGLRNWYAHCNVILSLGHLVQSLIIFPLHKIDYINKYRWPLNKISKII